MSPDRVPARAAGAATIRLDGIEKAFGAVPVLRQVSLEIRAGRILGLVGENGAGKSTLMNVLGGVVPPDGGSMYFDGRRYAPANPGDAREAGIAFVHQELTLFPNLTVAENLQLTAFPRRRGLPWIDRRASAGRARDLLERVGLARGPDEPLERLTAGERQLVEIARALGAHARVLILDEPTTSLGATDRQRLLALLRDLRTRGMAGVYISHDLGEVLQLCDDIAVMRDGAVVARGGAGEFSAGRLVNLMVGRVVRPDPESAHDAAAAPRLEVRGVRLEGHPGEVSLTVGEGEIVGIFGLLGAGRSRLMRAIFGLERTSAGKVLLDGHALGGGPRPRIRRGLAFVTEDRRGDGLLLEAPIGDNLTLVHLGALTRTPLRIVDRRRFRAAVAATARAVRLSGAVDLAAPAGRLSGGNQQKVVIGKWLMGTPRVLLLDEPTRGIDVGARAEIYELVRTLTRSGTGVLAVSSDLEELTGLCTRILVMRGGGVTAEFPRGAFDREAILRAALPARVSP